MRSLVLVLAASVAASSGVCEYGYEDACKDRKAPAPLQARCPDEAQHHWGSFDYGLVAEYRNRLVDACVAKGGKGKTGKTGKNKSSLKWTESQYGSQRNFAVGTNILLDVAGLKGSNDQWPGVEGLLSGSCEMTREVGHQERGFSWGGDLRVKKAKLKGTGKCEAGSKNTHPRPVLLVSRESIVFNVYHVLTDVDMAYVSAHAGGLLSPQSGAGVEGTHRREFDVVFLDDAMEGNGFGMWTAMAGGRAPLRASSLGDSDTPYCFPEIVFSIPSRSSFHYGWGLNPPCGESNMLQDFAHAQVDGTPGLGGVRAAVAAKVKGKGNKSMEEVVEGVGTRKGRKLQLTFCVRKETGYGRRITNQKAVLAALKKELGPNVRVKGVDFGKLSWAEQVKTAAKTDIFMGMHGAGMTHLLWLPDGGSVVEMFPKDHEDLDYWKLASMRGLGYFKWTNSHASKNWVPEGKTAVFGDVEVTISELIQVARSAVESRREKLGEQDQRAAAASSEKKPAAAAAQADDVMVEVGVAADGTVSATPVHTVSASTTPSAETSDASKAVSYAAQLSQSERQAAKAAGHAGGPKAKGGAFVTMIDKLVLKYHQGALALFQSLRDVGTEADLVCMISPYSHDKELPAMPEYVAAFERLGVKFVVIEEFPKPSYVDPVSAWYTPWDKLRAWEMTQYDSVVFLDADMLILKNIDHLLDMPVGQDVSFTGFRCYECERVDKHDMSMTQFSSGMFALRPSKHTYDAMVAYAHSHCPRDFSAYHNTPAGQFPNDQLFLQVFFLDNPGWKIEYISLLYNSNPFTCHCPEKSIGGWDSPGGDYWKDIQAIHFGCTSKPWETPTPLSAPDDSYILDKDSTGCYTKQLQMWWDALEKALAVD